jgi:hypothetical protein
MAELDYTVDEIAGAASQRVGERAGVSTAKVESREEPGKGAVPKALPGGRGKSRRAGRKARKHHKKKPKK